MKSKRVCDHMVHLIPGFDAVQKCGLLSAMSRDLE